MHRDFHLDRQYIIRDGEIVIVDEFTGRLAEVERWQAVFIKRSNAKERVMTDKDLEVTVETGQAARITVQDLFHRYKHIDWDDRYGIDER